MQVIKSLGINLKDARTETEKIIGRGSGFVAVEIPFTPRAKRVLELSLEEARQLGKGSYLNLGGAIVRQLCLCTARIITFFPLDADVDAAGHNYIGTEHILLGLLREGEGVASRVLEALGADPQKIRSSVSWQHSIFLAGPCLTYKVCAM